jgi:protocatechuate 3,4-dioxygenase beta subunit
MRSKSTTARRLLPLLTPLVVLISLSAARPLAAGDLVVTGITLDGEGHPLAGARVTLYETPSRLREGELLLSGKPHGEPAARAVSDAGGGFRLEAPAPGFYTVVARHEGRVPLEHRLEPLIAAADLEPAYLGADDGLAVQVVDGAGQPVPGARVWFERLGSPRPRREGTPWGWRPSALRMATTGREGRATLRRLEGEVGVLRAVAPGLAGAVEVSPRAAGSRARAVLTPTPGRRIRTVGKDGRPLAGAVAWTGALIPAGRTGEDGLLEVPLPEGRPAVVHVEVPGGRMADLEIGAPGKDDAGPLDVVLEPAPEVAGRVVAEDGGAGIVGALVWPTLDPASAVESGRGGAFRLSLPRIAGGELAAVAPGYLPAGLRALDASGDPVQGPVLSLQPAAHLAGRVVDAAGRPLAGAAVRAVPVQGSAFVPLPATAPRRARSGSDGRFRVDGMPAGASLSVRATLDGFAPWQQRVAPETAAREGAAGAVPGYPAVEIVLSAGARIRGRLVDEDGAPVAGAEVALTPRDGERQPWGAEPEGAQRVVSGQGGVFELLDLPVGRVDLEVDAARHPPLARPGVEVRRLGETVDLGDLVLGPEAVLDGVVEDSKGAPIAGAEVRVGEGVRRPFWLGGAGADEGSRLTGPGGEFRIERLRPGDLVALEVSKEGYAAAAPAIVRVPAEDPVHVVLQPVAHVSGRVVDEAGRGVSDAMILPSADHFGRATFSHTAPSEEDGSFEVETGPGAVRLTARKEGFRPASPVLLELETGERREGVELVLRASPQVRGRVLTPDGEPAAEAMVLVTALQAGEGLSTEGRSTEADGSFALDVAPGRAHLEATKEGYAAASREVVVTDAGVDVKLRLGRGAEVSGRVLGPDGEPAPGRQVQLVSGALIKHASHGAASAADGSFALRGVEDGTYRLLVLGDPMSAARHGAAYSHPKEIVVQGGAPVGGILVRLPAEATIRGRLLGLEPGEVPATTILARGGEAGAGGARPGTVLDGGRYEVPDVGPGRWEVIAWVPARGKSGRGTIEIAPGQGEASLDLELRQGLTVTGSVLWNGEPAPGVQVQTMGRHLGAGGLAVTGTDGRFELSGLSPGSQEIVISDPARGLWTSRTVEAYGGEDLLLEVDTARVSGTVLSATGLAPLADARVQLTGGARDDGSVLPTPRTLSAVDGAFLLEGVEPGSYRLRVEKPGYGARSVPVEVGEGGVSLPPLVLEPAGELDLRVRSADGKPVERVVVTALGLDGSPVFETWLVSSGDGRFVVDTLPPGRWELLVRGMDGSRAREVAQAPGPPVAMVLAPPPDAESVEPP